MAKQIIANMRRISLRGMLLTYKELRPTLQELCEKFIVCEHCGGNGYVDYVDDVDIDERYIVALPKDHKLNEDLEKVHNISEYIRKLVYQESGMRKHCEECDGKGYTKRTK